MYACAAAANQSLLSSINDGVAQVHENKNNWKLNQKNCTMKQQYL